MRDVVGFEGSYSIEEDGRVFSLKRKIYLAPRPDRDGYMRVNLYKNGKLYTRFIHRLLAEAYIPNPDNLPHIDHIDRNVKNNALSNLRWASRETNQRNRSNCRAVINLDTNERFSSLIEAAESLKDIKVSAKSAAVNIGKCCRGTAKTAYGMRWCYSDEACGK